MNRPTLTIRTAPLARNLSRLAHGGKPLLPVLKADAYGVGISAFLPALLSAAEQANQTFSALCIATLDEGLELRELGWQGGILLLGPTAEYQWEDLLDQQICPLLDSADLVAAWTRRAPSHCGILVDTGMSRRGLAAELLSSVLTKLPAGCRVDLATHHACADLPDSEVPPRQKNLWNEKTSAIPVTPYRIHSANSAALLNAFVGDNDTHVRPGLAVYGTDPENLHRIEPVFDLQAPLAEIRTISKGAGISYRHEFVASRTMTIGVVPCGYAHGLPIAAGQTIRPQLGEYRMPIVGRITMDMLLVDLHDIPEKIWSEPVVLMGIDGVRVEDWASASERSSYEILTGLGRRWQRRIAA